MPVTSIHINQCLMKLCHSHDNLYRFYSYFVQSYSKFMMTDPIDNISCLHVTEKSMSSQSNKLYTLKQFSNLSIVQSNNSTYQMQYKSISQYTKLFWLQ